VSPADGATIGGGHRQTLDCLKLTKSIQKTADALQSVADMYDDHARRTQLITHEALKGVSHPYTTYAVRLSCNQKNADGQVKCSLAHFRYSLIDRNSVSRSLSFHCRSARGNQRTMRNGAEHDDGRDGDIPLPKDRGF
jgi:hypothetical protein